jgi:CDP-diacylglycerol--serine O-phosphatidyltransferase
MLPTALTLGNLFCGFLAIAYAADASATAFLPDAHGVFETRRLEMFRMAGWMIFLGMVFDALDGSVARLSGGTSALGAQLDSICDIVTFGVAPAFLAKAVAESVGLMGNHRLTLYFSVFFAAMAALRLARYNSQHGDPEEANLWFQGLPTPGAAAVLAGMALLLPDRDFRPGGTVLNVLPWATLGLGLLMVSKFPYAHVTNRLLRGRKPVHYIAVGMALLVLTLAFHPEVVLAVAALSYALSGPVVALVRRIRGHDRKEAAAAGGESPT